LRVSLLGSFELAAGVERVAVAPASQRLLAYVALAGRAVRRELAAGALWPTVREHLAHGSLRAALARLTARAPGVVHADGPDVSLVAGVVVDLHDAQAIARRLLADAAAVDPDAAAAAIADLSAELLPGWYEDWTLVEAENWRQLRLHALEEVAGVLADAERFGEAVGAAQAAVAADPLQESPHAALIAVHMREGKPVRGAARVRALSLAARRGAGARADPPAARAAARLSRRSRCGHAGRGCLPHGGRARRLAGRACLGRGAGAVRPPRRPRPPGVARPPAPLDALAG
jgi:SARP family transcriptional regulator, regulator of embCAB operon